MSRLSPTTLLSIAVDAVARHYDFLCHEVLDEVRSQIGNVPFSKLVFKDGHSLPPNISELLFQRLIDAQNYSINSDILKLFVDPEVCRLQKLCFGNVPSSELCSSDVKRILKLVLQRQKLSELEVSSVMLDFIDEDYSFSTSAFSLKRLTLCPVDSSCVDFILTFKNLKHLDVSNSKMDIGDKEVGLFASCLMNLESLDVSSSQVETVEAFGILKVKLKSLSLHQTPLVYRNVLEILEFSNLEFLDISKSCDTVDSDELHDYNMLYQFLMTRDMLQALISLDISGAGKVDNMALQCFIECHTKLRFLGLFNVNQSVYSANQVPRNIEITSDETVDQVICCLRHYKNRPPYLVKALNELFRFCSENYLKDQAQHRKIIVQLLLTLMTKYMSKENEALQTAASACVYGFIKDDNDAGPNSLHISIISEVVSVIIRVLSTFPNAKQIQRNCLIVLYNNYLLSSAKFDGFVLSKLIFKASLLLPDNNITNLALKMCAYLSSKISVEETLKLGTLENIRKLLSIIQSQSSSNTVDSLLLSALRVLWNLTDEAPKTCQLVMDLDGLRMLILALRTFNDKNKVLTKLLGILNNLAEVISLRPQLMNDDLLSLLRKYLDENYQINVGYFAAGIICNLAMDWPDGLRLSCGSQEDLLSSVGAAVNKWKKISKVMVGYRTFRSFIPLMRSCFPDCQLWAIWAIRHVCSRSEYPVERYIQLCKEEGIIEILESLKSSPETRSDVKNLAMEAGVVVF